MPSRNPTLIISFSTRGYRWSIGSEDRHLVSWIHLLRLARRSLSSFAAFASTFLLWEESGYPSAVDEVASSSECGEQKQV